MADPAVRRTKFYKDGPEPVKDWLDELKRKKKFVEHIKIIVRIDRAAQGNLGDHRLLGGAFGELKIDFGPGYRVYFGLAGDQLIVLLSGGTKNDQQANIELAKSRWQRYLNEHAKGNSDGK